MKLFTLGSGPPLVLVPGVQGRWEWMLPALRALASHFHVVTCSLAGEPGSGMRPADPRLGFDLHVQFVEQVFDDAGIESAVLCGVSFGGLVAIRYAAVRASRVKSLVLASTPGPSWRPDERTQRYARSPRASALGFAAGAPGRMWPEILAALPVRRDRWRATAGCLATILTHPPSPARMAERVRTVAGHDFTADAAAIRVPTLVITGEPNLDRVVPVDGTREYLDLIPDSIGRILPHTGHVGLVTRPREFSELIRAFAGGTGGPTEDLPGVARP